MPNAQKLPREHSEMDEHHLLTFKQSVPWWFRPSLRETPFAVTDFIADIRGRLERSISRANPAMGRIFQSRRKLAQAFSYRAARDSACFAKTGYGKEEYVNFMQGTLDVMHRAKRMGIPEGDPQFGNIGTSSKEHTSGRPIFLVDLTADEKKLVDWLKRRENITSVFDDDELRKYVSRYPSTRYVLYATRLRQNITEVLQAVPDMSLDEEWREACVDLCINEMITIGEENQQKALAGIVDDDPGESYLSAEPQNVIDHYVAPRRGDATALRSCLSLLERVFAAKASEGDLEAMQAYVQEWNTITKKLDIAPNERATGGIASLAITCAAEQPSEIRRWLGPLSS
ncbi:MAG: hypothetical protein KC680_01790 [Candidatus Peregrinibacteria bacterium]|nr:hypothetical protein [Candidatus Peregrinibacteria bacterium]MCB9807681.1 hypothetical protein [Candidatus Peribacteria bacterium]